MQKETMEIIPFGRALDRLWAFGLHVLHLCSAEATDNHPADYRPPEASEIAETGAEAMIYRSVSEIPDDVLYNADLSGFGYIEGTEY